MSTVAVGRRQLLFAHGTLCHPDVQRAVFGRELVGTADSIVGYGLAQLRVTDPVVIDRSGSDQHSFLMVCDGRSRVEGYLYDVTDRDLDAADEYRNDDYTRVRVPLESGLQAWVYAFNPT